MAKRGQDPGLVLALASGICSALAFPPFGLSPLVLVAPVPLLWGLASGGGSGGRRAFLLGWTAAFAHGVFVLHWILWLPSEEYTIPGLMIPALLFLCAYLGLFFGAAAALACGVASRLRLPLGIVWAVMVALADYARSVGELAFPWGSHAYALSRMPFVFQFTSVTGFWGLALWVALCGGLLYQALRSAGRARTLYVAAFAILLVGASVHGSIVMRRAPDDAVDGPAGLRVVMIQPNTSRTIKWNPLYRDLVIDDLLERTVEAAKGKPDLILWPETAAPIVLLKEPVYLSRVESTVRLLGVPLLAGSLDEELIDGRYVAHNSAVLLDAAGRIVDRYDKRRLVPFSERMPFQKTAPWLSGLNFGQSDFSPGERTVLFSVGGGRIGCLICFESIFTDLARAEVAAGANILVNITNDFWFGRTAAPIQHAEMAVFRSVETRTPLLRCANTGVSMVVDPWGRVFHRTRTFVEALVETRVAPGSGSTFYVRHGDWLPRSLLALFAALIIGAASVPRRGAG